MYLRFPALNIYRYSARHHSIAGDLSELLLRVKDS